MKEALKLALEAMQRYQVKRQDFDRFADEITAIQQALAAPVQEPVATLFGSLPVYDTPPVQEPVATIDSLEQEIYENTREFVSLNVMEWLLNRLNTTPPAAQPAVPDAIHHTDLSEHPQYIEGWNDCRAEMLKGMK